MKKFLLVGLALATALATAPGAKADTFNITLSDGLTGSGTITGTAIAGGFDITSASLTIDGFGATLIGNSYSPGVEYDDFTMSSFSSTAPSHLDDYINYDDTLVGVPSSPYLDGNGFLFELSDGEYINIFSSGSSDYWFGYGSTGNADFSNTLTGNNAGYAFTPSFATGGDLVDLSIALAPTPTVPEPSSLLLLGTGLLLLAGIVFKKSRMGAIQA